MVWYRRTRRRSMREVGRGWHHEYRNRWHQPLRRYCFIYHTCDIFCLPHLGHILFTTLGTYFAYHTCDILCLSNLWHLLFTTLVTYFVYHTCDIFFTTLVTYLFTTLVTYFVYPTCDIFCLHTCDIFVYTLVTCISQLDAALTIDSVSVVIHGLTAFLNVPDQDIFRGTFRRGQVYNNDGNRGIECGKEPIVPWTHGAAIMTNFKDVSLPTYLCYSIETDITKYFYLSFYLFYLFFFYFFYKDVVIITNNYCPSFTRI